MKVDPFINQIIIKLSITLTAMRTTLFSILDVQTTLRITEALSDCSVICMSAAAGHWRGNRPVRACV